MLAILVRALAAAVVSPCVTAATVYAHMFRDDPLGCTVAVAAAVAAIVFYDRYANLATAILAVPVGGVVTYKIQCLYTK